VRELLDSPAEGAARGRRGREHVVATSSWRVVVDGWLEHLDRWRSKGGRAR